MVVDGPKERSVNVALFFAGGGGPIRIPWKDDRMNHKTHKNK